MIYISKIELKCIESKVEIVLKSTLNHVKIISFEKLHSKMNPTSYFFKKML